VPAGTDSARARRTPQSAPTPTNASPAALSSGPEMSRFTTMVSEAMTNSAGTHLWPQTHYAGRLLTLPV
jgi:hypothetical protein